MRRPAPSRLLRRLPTLLIGAAFALHFARAAESSPPPPKPAAKSAAGEPIFRDITKPTEEELTAFLVPEPSKSPAEALKTFETVGGFRMELVAAEPMVYDPVAAAFDEDGNLYVGEMRDYPYPGSKQSGHTPRFKGDKFAPTDYAPPIAGKHPVTKPGDKPLGSVRLLRDTNGDGVFDESYVFADGLLWVAGIVPWKGGIFASAPPDIWFLKDTDGDGKADVRVKIFTGFGTRNQQAMVNNLQFGLDHMIYGSAAGNGGEIRPGNDPTAAAIVIDRHDFRFSPQSPQLERVTGTKQFGLTFDDWGNRFLCTQNAPCFHVVLPLHYLARNPYFTPRQTIASTTPVPTPLYRISPVERWRHLQSSRALAERDPSVTTIAGVTHNVVDACAGITLYRGGAYPKQYYGNIFVGDSVSNLVHRRVLVPDGVTFKSERADANTEFLRSSDIWFRPVNFVNAPDGTLYCLDMSREYSESINIPPDIERHMDLTTRDQGRIYRIAPPGFRSPPPPRLSRSTTVELVRALESPHGWWRDTAHRLLYERQDSSAVPALEALARGSPAPETRVLALWSLQGLEKLSDAVIVSALGDSHPGVRENAIRLAEPRLEGTPEIRAKVLALVSDPAPRVRLQVAFSVGESRQWDQAAVLTRLARENPADPWIQSAILSSTADCSGELFATLAADSALLTSPAGLDFFRQLITIIGAQNRTSDVVRTIKRLAEIKDANALLPLVSALAEGLKRAGTSLASADAESRMKAVLQQAKPLVADATQPAPLRRSAIEALGLFSYADAAPSLLGVLQAREPEPLQLAALAALDQFRDAQLGQELIQRISILKPAVRTRVLDLLLERPDRLNALWSGLEKKQVMPADLSARQTDLLRKHADPHVREQATRLLGAANSASRQEVYTNFLTALQMQGVAARGKAIFESRCAMCHQYAGLGHELGPDLTAARTGGAEKLLTSIVDPNREVLPQYFISSVEMKDGETIGGIVRNETTTTVTLRQPGGTERTLPRAGIATIKTINQSLMPEGLEAGLTTQDMADLIQFIFAPGS
jgi:putative membrane-bound dehydrogenase-like protein